MKSVASAHNGCFVTEIREILTAASDCAGAVGRQLAVKMLGRASQILPRYILQRNTLMRNIFGHGGSTQQA